MRDMKIQLDDGAIYNIADAPTWLIQSALDSTMAIKCHEVALEDVLERCKIELIARGLEGRL